MGWNASTGNPMVILRDPLSAFFCDAEQRDLWIDTEGGRCHAPVDNKETLHIVRLTVRIDDGGVRVASHPTSSQGMRTVKRYFIRSPMSVRELRIDFVDRFE